MDESRDEFLLPEEQGEPFEEGAWGEPEPWRVFAPPVFPNLLRRRPPRPLPKVVPGAVPRFSGAARPNRLGLNRLRLGR